MTADTLIGHDVYLRFHDPSGKSADVIEAFRSWNPPGFIAKQQEAYAAAKGNDFRVVTVATRDEYRAHKWKGRVTA